jgi:hypothetical protein
MSDGLPPPDEVQRELRMDTLARERELLNDLAHVHAINARLSMMLAMTQEQLDMTRERLHEALTKNYEDESGDKT